LQMAACFLCVDKNRFEWPEIISILLAEEMIDCHSRCISLDWWFKVLRLFYRCRR
jgi:hypothetical protein